MGTSSGLRPMSIAMTREIMMVTRDISVDSRAAVAMTREMPTREMLVLGRPGGSLLGLRPMSIESRDGHPRYVDSRAAGWIIAWTREMVTAIC